jgi:hypothetical protein
MNAIRREGVGRFTGQPLWTGWDGQGGYLPRIPPLASEVGFCRFRYRRWDTWFRSLCMLRRSSHLLRLDRSPELIDFSKNPGSVLAFNSVQEEVGVNPNFDFDSVEN